LPIISRGDDRSARDLCWAFSNNTGDIHSTDTCRHIHDLDVALKI
jgi:hypothetical protein